MSFELPYLPFDKKALEPHISEETINFHYGKHHAGYVNKLNKAVDGTDLEQKSLEEIIKTSSGAVFNNAAQVWNHSFYWNCLSGSSNEKDISVELSSAINGSFGSLEKFKEEFIKKASGLFGSGWTWLVRDDDRLSIITASNAGNPIVDEKVPLLVCDVWEHAYYIDYRNARAKYLDAFWSLINWRFVSENFK